jgi:hypothetical protein
MNIATLSCPSKLYMSAFQGSLYLLAAFFTWCIFFTCTSSFVDSKAFGRFLPYTFTSDGERNLSQTASLSIQLLLINWLQPLCGPSPVPPPAHRWRRPFSPFSPLITSVCFFVNNYMTTNFRLHDEEMVNGLRKIYRASIFCFKQQHVNINIYICTYANTHTSPPTHTLQMETEMANFCLFAANRNENGSLFSLVSNQ